MEKYLREYAEPGTAAVQDIPVGELWGQVLVIPVCDESTDILRPLPPGPGRSLMILVVNEVEAAALHVSSANRKFASEVHARFTRYWQSDTDFGLSLFHDPASTRDVLLVDRFSDGLKLPPRGGVGHARKIGADLATYLILNKRLQSSWIHCSDADVCLPRGYFSCSLMVGETSARETAALLYPFRHCISAEGVKGDESANIHQQEVMRLTRLYEYSLRYYVAGLAYAGSPYAFHTIGSTIAVNAAHYAKVRGFPRRQAGEDFYLLNKLAKVGSVRQLSAEADCEPIEITARQSDRVPFGTGAAVGKIMAMECPIEEFLLYNPAVFDLLGGWLGSLPTFWQLRTSDLTAVLPQLDLDILIEPLEAQGVAKTLRHALRQSSDAAQFERQMHTWFDAFRTLKLIHYLRDHHLPSINFETLKNLQNLEQLLDYEPVLPGQHKQICGNPASL